MCRKWDGSLHDILTRKSLVGPTKGQTTPTLPLHPGERSLFAPAVDGEVIGERPLRGFTSQQLVREYAEANGLDIPKPTGQTLDAAKKVIPHGHKGAFDSFARKRMRELTGTVPAKTTYTQFLKRQSASFQNDILGPTRGKLFCRSSTRTRSAQQG